MPKIDTDADTAGSKSRRVSRWHSSAIPGVIIAPSAHRLAAVARAQEHESGSVLLDLSERAANRAARYREIDEISILEAGGKTVIR